MARVFLRLVLGGMAGKVLGLLRETLLAALFGAGRVVAANRVALTATFIPVNFFTADALSAGFLPLYVRYRKEGSAMASALYRGVRLVLAALSLLLMVVLLLGADIWVGLLAPGFDSETAHIAATMLRVAALGAEHRSHRRDRCRLRVRPGRLAGLGLHPLVRSAVWLGYVLGPPAGLPGRRPGLRCRACPPAGLPGGYCRVLATAPAAAPGAAGPARVDRRRARRRLAAGRRGRGRDGVLPLRG